MTKGGRKSRREKEKMCGPHFKRSTNDIFIRDLALILDLHSWDNYFRQLLNVLSIRNWNFVETQKITFVNWMAVNVYASHTHRNSRKKPKNRAVYQSSIGRLFTYFSVSLFVMSTLTSIQCWCICGLKSNWLRKCLSQFLLFPLTSLFSYII